MECSNLVEIIKAIGLPIMVVGVAWAIAYSSRGSE